METMVLTYCHEKRHERWVMEVELHLLIQGLPGGSGEQIRSKHLESNIEWRHDAILLVHFRPYKRQYVSPLLPMSDKTATHKVFPSSKSMLSLDSFHVDSIFKTCLISDCEPATN